MFFGIGSVALWMCCLPFFVGLFLEFMSDPEAYINGYRRKKEHRRQLDEANKDNLFYQVIRITNLLIRVALVITLIILFISVG